MSLSPSNGGHSWDFGFSRTLNFGKFLTQKIRRWYGELPYALYPDSSTLYIQLHLLDLLCPCVYICIFPPNLLKVGDIVSLQHFVPKHPPMKNSETIPPSKDEDLVPLRTAKQNVLSHGNFWNKCRHLMRSLWREYPQRELGLLGHLLIKLPHSMIVKLHTILEFQLLENRACKRGASFSVHLLRYWAAGVKPQVLPPKGAIFTRQRVNPSPLRSVMRE